MDPSEGTIELKVLADMTLICKSIGSCMHLKRMLTAFGKPIGRPWRVEEKAAALGAWLAIASH